AELTLEEINRLSTSDVPGDELVPRKSVLTGNFGRNLETTAGLASAVGELYAFGISAAELNAYVNKVNGVSPENIKEFASNHFAGGTVIIVGDYSVFKDDLAKRFPKWKINVVQADKLDLRKDNLQK